MTEDGGLKMDILRRNTDYGLRAMVNLASRYDGKLVSARELSFEEDISYQLVCKILQRLHKAGLVKSSMGPKGGFQLSRGPSKINLLEVIRVLQGPVRLNRCLLGVNSCPKRTKCSVRSKLGELQRQIDGFLRDITLDKLPANKVATRKYKKLKRENR